MERQDEGLVKKSYNKNNNRPRLKSPRAERYPRSARDEIGRQQDLILSLVSGP